MTSCGFNCPSLGHLPARWLAVPGWDTAPGQWFAKHWTLHLGPTTLPWSFQQKVRVLMYLAFDLEIAKAIPDGDDWNQYRPFGISVAATLTDAGELRLWYGGPGPDGTPWPKMSVTQVQVLVTYLKCMAQRGLHHRHLERTRLRLPRPGRGVGAFC